MSKVDSYLPYSVAEKIQSHFPNVRDFHRKKISGSDISYQQLKRYLNMEQCPEDAIKLLTRISDSLRKFDQYNEEGLHGVLDCCLRTMSHFPALIETGETEKVLDAIRELLEIHYEKIY